LGKTDPELFPPEIASIFIEHDQKVLKTKKVLEVEESTLDETGSVCHWWVMKFLIPRQGGPGWLGGVALDITDRKKDHEVLQQREAELQGSKKILQALGGRLLSAQEDERRRISRELHDDMNQRLAVLAFNIQSVQKGLDLSDLMYQNLQNLYDGVSSISDDVRRLAYQLHPSILDDLGLNVALRSFVSDFTKWGGIPVEYSSTDVPVSLPPEISSCLYRVAQESLRNAARHAECSKIEVRLLGVDGGLRLSILDNGKGFEVKKGRPGVHGLGLIGMEERVRVVEGTYEVKSAPGQGTKITVWVPISP
jgi:signal transduction histidine kinase